MGEKKKNKCKSNKKTKLRVEKVAQDRRGWKKNEQRILEYCQQQIKTRYFNCSVDFDNVAAYERRKKFCAFKLEFSQIEFLFVTKIHTSALSAATSVEWRKLK